MIQQMLDHTLEVNII